MVTLMIADDEQLERQALRYIIEKKCPHIRIVAETGDGTSAIQLADSQKPDIILMDIRAGGEWSGSGAEDPPAAARGYDRDADCF